MKTNRNRNAELMLRIYESVIFPGKCQHLSRNEREVFRSVWSYDITYLYPSVYKKNDTDWMEICCFGSNYRSSFLCLVSLLGFFQPPPIQGFLEKHHTHTYTRMMIFYLFLLYIFLYYVSVVRLHFVGSSSVVCLCFVGCLSVVCHL